jgi:hypothetical protein
MITLYTTSNYITIMLKTIVSLVELTVAIVTLMLMINIYMTMISLMAQMTTGYLNMFNFFNKLSYRIMDNPQGNSFTNPDINYPMLDGFKN